MLDSARLGLGALQCIRLANGLNDSFSALWDIFKNFELIISYRPTRSDNFLARTVYNACGFHWRLQLTITPADSVVNYCYVKRLCDFLSLTFLCLPSPSTLKVVRFGWNWHTHSGYIWPTTFKISLSYIPLTWVFVVGIRIGWSSREICAFLFDHFFPR